MSAERDLAEAIYTAMVSDQALDHAERCWHIHSYEQPLRTRLALVLSAVASAAIDTVLARRQREAARSGPWEGSQRGCVCPPTSEQTCKGPLCPRRGIGAAGAMSIAGEP